MSERPSKRVNPTRSSFLSSTGKLFTVRESLPAGPPGDSIEIELPENAEAMLLKNAGNTELKINFNAEDIEVNYFTLSAGEVLPVWIPIDGKTKLNGRSNGGSPATIEIIFRG